MRATRGGGTTAAEPLVSVFVVWPAAMDWLDEIRRDVAERFTLLAAYELDWPVERFDAQLLRFYGYDVAVRDKLTASTSGRLAVLVVRDEDPRFVVRQSNHGLVPVHDAVRAAKRRYRELTGGAFSVHGSDDPAEARRDLFLLLGMELDELRGAPGLPAHAPLTPHGGGPVAVEAWAGVAQLCVAADLVAGCVVVSSAPGELTLLSANPRDVRTLLGRDSVLIAGEMTRVVLLGADETPVPVGWAQAVVRERRRAAGGWFEPTEEHAFHLALWRRGAGVDVAVPDWPGALPGDHDDPVFAAAVLHEFLYQNGWVPARRPPRHGRRARALARRARRVARQQLAALRDGRRAS